MQLKQALDFIFITIIVTAIARNLTSIGAKVEPTGIAEPKHSTVLLE